MADQPQGYGTSSGTGCKGTHVARRATMVAQSQETMAESPCGACKFMKRKCVAGCIFAPHFGVDQGASKFAVVHKVFGASNFSKLLSYVPESRRSEAVATIFYEAQARLADPVYGCVSSIFALQKQVASLQAEIVMTQTQLTTNRFVYATALQNTQQLPLQQPNMNMVMQPPYSNNSSASINFMNMRNFNPGFGLATGTGPSSQSLEPLQLSLVSQYEEEDEEESKIPQIFNHDIGPHGH
ncbi:hypothetical protein RIF29_03510 [Crotalaria pallida]|uniref:LOB domain-containing protein n=1 Tax=Crotalaria pallida TaxID=3830 RepID=A0AAN9J007_CROPI